MKTFAYKIEELRRRSGYSVKRVTLWRISRSDITQVATEEYSFKSDIQAAIELANAKGLFKPAPRHANGSPDYSHEGGFTICGDARFKQI